MIRSSNEQSLKQAIEELLETYRLQDGLNNVRLKEEWEKQMGKVITSKTVNVVLKRGELIVHLNSSVLRQELLYKVDDIKKALNEALGSEVVKTVRLA